MDILLIVLGVIFVFDGFVYYFTEDDRGLFSAIMAISILILVKSFYITMAPSLGGIYALWGIRAFCILCIILSFPKILGFSLRAVVRDQDGNIVCDEDGNPLVGKKAREYMKGTRGKTYRVDLKTPDGDPAPKEVSDKVNEYFKQFLDKHGELKEFDEDGTPITEEYLNEKLRSFIRHEFGEEAISLGDYEKQNGSSFEELMERLSNTTNLDVIKEMDAEAFVDMVKELFDESLCKDCCEYEECTKKPREEYEREHRQCIIDLLNEPIVNIQTPEEALKEEKDDSDKGQA